MLGQASFKRFHIDFSLAVFLALATIMVVVAVGLVLWSPWSGKSAPGGGFGAARAFLDSLGSPPEAVLVREYRTEHGALGRVYATTRPLSEAATTMSVFYRDQLVAQGWQVKAEHAAVSNYSKGDGEFAIFRYGPELPVVARDMTVVSTAAAPSDADFFLGIEVKLPAGSYLAIPTDQQLVDLGQQVFPFQSQFGYYGVCGVNGDTTGCPYSTRLRARLDAAKATLCRCQNPSPTLDLNGVARPGGGIVDASLFDGSVNFELVVITENGRLVVDDERCAGGSEDTSIYSSIESCNRAQQ